MNKQNVIIDWTRLPHWARYVAQDANGSWWVYAEKPYVANNAWGNRGAQPAFRISEHLAPRGFTGHWEDSLFCRDDREIQEQVTTPLEEVQDIVERQLWVEVYLMEYRDQHGQIGAYVEGPGELADKAVAEYRKRYGAER